MLLTAEVVCCNAYLCERLRRTGDLPTSTILHLFTAPSCSHNA